MGQQTIWTIWVNEFFKNHDRKSLNRYSSCPDDETFVYLATVYATSHRKMSESEAKSKQCFRIRYGFLGISRRYHEWECMVSDIWEYARLQLHHG